MNQRIKGWLIAAAVLTVLGGLLFAGAMAILHWDFTMLGTVRYETNTIEVGDAFDKISIDVDTTEITFAPAEGETCSIRCVETEKVKHRALVEAGTLFIDLVDSRKWYDHIGIFFGSPKITVYLPGKAYESMVIDTDTGDISIPKEFSFKSLQIDGETSDVKCFASVADRMDVQLSTGDILLDTISAGALHLDTNTGDVKIQGAIIQKEIEVETDTGEVAIKDATFEGLLAKSDTGDIRLENAVASGQWSIETDTGDVRFKSSDAPQIRVETDTGDVRGTLRSEKVFITETDTGRVDVPQSIHGGRCEIKTSTGDIKINIA